jgi:hypothetical protein
MRHLLPILLVLACVLALAPVSEAGPTSARDAALMAKLRKQRLSNVKFEKMTLPNVVKWLRVATGQNILLKHAVLAKADIAPEDIAVSIELRDVTVTQLLKLVLEPHGLAAQVKSNIVFITTKADSYGRPVTVMYAITHLTYKKIDFIAPELSLKTDGEAGIEYEPEVEVEDDTLSTGDAVIDLIKQMVLPEGWESNDDWRITGTDRYILVRAPRSVQKLIPRVLDQLQSIK